MDPRNRQRLAQFVEAERASVREEREQARTRTLDEGLADAIALAALTVAEMARRVGGDEAALLRILADQGPPFSLRERWNALHPAGRP